MEDYLQTEWPDLDVWLTSTTEQWAVIAVQGPNARKVLEPLVEGIDLAKEAMPHMSVRQGRIAGVPTRLFRVSFTGELGFEVNVPADYGRHVWEAIVAAGAAHGITPYGTETMHVLRAEKGYIIVGQETDGTATPDDVNLGWAVGKAKKDFVGKRSVLRPEMTGAGRKQLVGLLTVDPTVVLEGGGADRRRPQRACADDDARPRHLVLLELGARPLDRARDGARRPRPDGGNAARADARRGDRGDGGRPRVRRPGRSAAQ